MQGFRDGEKIEDRCVNLVGVDDFGASQVVLVVKNPPANAGDIEMQVRPLGWEDPLEEEMATLSNILA